MCYYTSAIRLEKKKYTCVGIYVVITTNNYNTSYMLMNYMLFFRFLVIVRTVWR